VLRLARTRGLSEDDAWGATQIGIARAVRKMTDIRREALMEVA
jgi:hypothetical protein